MAGFIDRHNLWTDAQKDAVEQIKATVKDKNLLLIRTAWEDQHGILRSKALLPQTFFSALENGMQISTGTYIFDSANALVYNPFVAGGSFELPEMTGCPNLILVPDPHTFRILPWAERTGLILCDQYFSNGKPMLLSSRFVLRQALNNLHQRDLEYIAGLEVEWYLTRLEDPMLSIEHIGAPGTPGTPPKVSAIEHSYQYLMEPQNPEIQAMLYRLAEQLVEMELPLRSVETEWAPGQFEFTFDPQSGLDAADTMMMFRMATKQICRQHGYLASFMCRPGLQGCYSSGWHLHQSLVDRLTGQNVFMSTDAAQSISELGKHFIGGILKHAQAASVFTTPTVNGYKRFKPFSLAPDRAGWGIENRGAMIRLQGGALDPTTHIENRVGEPAANPYLYLASQIISGLDGLDRALDPGSPTDEPYEDDRSPLPKSLMEATIALQQDELFKTAMGEAFVQFILKMKQSEIDRFLAAVGESPQDSLEQITDWEHREYFELF